jgi:hypothetical protein
MPEQPQDAGERASELHDLGGKFRHGVFVDPRPSVVNKHSGPVLLTFVLDRQRRQPQVLVQFSHLLEG